MFDFMNSLDAPESLVELAGKAVETVGEVIENQMLQDIANGLVVLLEKTAARRYIDRISGR